MAILVNADTRVLCQGITGAFGAVHTKGCHLYGTNMVGGVTPGKGGTKDPNGLPIFDTVDSAVRATAANATMIFVPPGGAGDAVLEAAAASIKLICCITEGVPVQDMIKVRAVLDVMNLNGAGITLVGPNCPGVITPGRKTGTGESGADPYTSKAKGGGGCKIGIMPGYIHTHISESKRGKAVGIVSRSGTLTYEAVWQTSQMGFGQSTCVGIGGDPVRGLNHLEIIKLFQNDPDTHGLLMIGEIGGSDEEAAAEYIKAERAAGRLTKPIAGFIAGRTAPPGRRMGHAGAIIESGGQGTADSKIKALQEAGVKIALSPADMGKAMAEAFGG